MIWYSSPVLEICAKFVVTQSWGLVNLCKIPWSVYLSRLFTSRREPYSPLPVPNFFSHLTHPTGACGDGFPSFFFFVGFLQSIPFSPPNPQTRSYTKHPFLLTPLQSNLIVTPLSYFSLSHPSVCRIFPRPGLWAFDSSTETDSSFYLELLKKEVTRRSPPPP